MKGLERPAKGPVGSCDGQDLKEMLALGTAWLERNASAIDALNVFPVPDGDTGTNMLLTMRSTLEGAYGVPDHNVAAVAKAMALGALMGARGNSGVILAQILRGLARGLEGKESFDGADLAHALEEASAYAYKGISHPVEGTILTVIREAAEAALAQSTQERRSVSLVMEATVRAAQAAVARTPLLLPVLREAGVVDAGGQGLYVLLEGALSYLHGEVKPEGPLPLGLPQAADMRPKVEEGIYGYCTEFLVEGVALNLDEIKERLSSMGDSLLVVGDESLVRLHLHTFDPGAVISYGTSLGSLKQVKVDNMQEQHREFLLAQKPGAAAIATVAVASGEGLIQVFQSLGATAVVPGGQTMNPSTRELLEAVKSVASDKVIILANNPNVITVARQVEGLTAKKVAVVPTQTIPQGVSALLAFNPEADLEVNLATMEEVRATVRTAEITTAVRSVRLKGLSAHRGQAIGFIDGELAAVGDSRLQVAHQLLAKMATSEGRLITLYYGADVDATEAEGLARSLRQRYPDREVEVVCGGQPHHHYIISLE